MLYFLGICVEPVSIKLKILKIFENHNRQIYISIHNTYPIGYI